MISDNQKAGLHGGLLHFTFGEQARLAEAVK
jgi:hypothetical protein